MSLKSLKLLNKEHFVKHYISSFCNSIKYWANRYKTQIWLILNYNTHAEQVKKFLREIWAMFWKLWEIKKFIEDIRSLNIPNIPHYTEPSWLAVKAILPLLKDSSVENCIMAMVVGVIWRRNSKFFRGQINIIHFAFRLWFYLNRF